MRQERKWPLGKSVHTQEFVSSPNSWDKAKLLLQNEQASKVKTNAFFGVQTSSPITTNPFDSVEIHSPPLAEYHTPPTLTRRSWPHKLRKTRKAKETWKELGSTTPFKIWYEAHNLQVVFIMICMGQCFSLQFHCTESWAIVEWESLILCTSSWPL